MKTSHKIIITTVIAFVFIAMIGSFNAAQPRYADGVVLNTGSAHIYIHNYWEDLDQYMTTSMLENDVATIYITQLVDREYIDNEAWKIDNIVFSEQQLNIIKSESALRWETKIKQTKKLDTAVTYNDIKAKGGTSYWI